MMLADVGGRGVKAEADPAILSRFPSRTILSDATLVHFRLSGALPEELGSYPTYPESMSLWCAVLLGKSVDDWHGGRSVITCCFFESLADFQAPGELTKLQLS